MDFLRKCFKEVDVGSNHEMAKSERASHSKKQVGKTKLTISYLY